MLNRWMNGLFALRHWVNGRSHYFQPKEHKKYSGPGLDLVLWDLGHIPIPPALDEDLSVKPIHFQTNKSRSKRGSNIHFRQPLHIAGRTAEAWGSEPRDTGGPGSPELGV